MATATTKISAKPRKLTAKQMRFVDEYLIDLNATQASIRAGYSPRTSYSIGVDLLKKPEIQTLLQKKRQKLSDKLEVSQEKVIKELAAVAFANGADYAKITAQGLVEFIPTDDLPKDKLAAIAGIKTSQSGTEVKLGDKLRALEMLGKYLGLFDGQQNAEKPENNLLDALNGIEKEGYDDIPEIQQPTKADSDLVE